MNEIELKPQNSSKRNRCCKSSKASSCTVTELTDSKQHCFVKCLLSISVLNCCYHTCWCDWLVWLIGVLWHFQYK